MSEILYIEGWKMDLSPDPITRTLQINNIGEVKDRQANFSNTTKLPMTPNNVKAFDFLGVSGNSSLKPYRKLRCDYILNGIPMVRNGYAVVKAANSHYEVVIYDGLIDLSERIKGKKLNELNFSDLNHYLTQSTYESSLLNTEGFIYALGEFLPRSGFSTIKIEEQAPSLFVKTVWDKIWEEAGLRYSGSFFSENTDFLTEVISPAKGYEVKNVELTSLLLGSGQTNIISRNTFSNDPLIRFEDQHTFQSGSFSGITMNPDGSLVTSEDGQLSLSIETSYSNNDSYVRLLVNLNGATKTWIDLPENLTSKTVTINLNVKAGDILTFVLAGTYEISQAEQEPEQQDTIHGKYSINYNAYSTIQITKLTGGQFIDFSTFVAEMDQLAFVKDVMQRYGLLIKPVKNTNSYDFIQFEEMLNDKANTEDWSEKLNEILGEKYDIQYARRNEATYAYPESIIDRVYDGVLTIDNENATPAKNLFSSPYQIPTSRSRTFKNKTVYQIPIWEEKEEDGETIIENKESPVKIFRISKVDTSIQTTFFDGANVITVTGMIPFLSLENMQMQYFLNKYYKAFKLLIDRAKQVDADFKLNEIDIYNLDFFRLKYLKQTGKYYYLNNLKHRPERIIKAELIQLNGFSVNLPPTILGVYSRTISYKNTTTITVDNITVQSNPAYFDPEFDQPMAIMFTGGFNSNILLKNGADVITTQTVINVADWNVTIQDAGNLTAEHSAAFTFKIKDAGSEQWSEVEGTIDVTVREYVNNPPVANAGPDQTVEIPIDQSSTLVSLNGSGSTDTTGSITSYAWSIVSMPSTSSAFLSGNSGVNGGLNVPNTEDSYGTYTIKLIVTDEFGATGEDTVSITVTFQQIQP
ncbi:hypothetical protein SAMN06296241_1366 [Salinimicrobium sediminis]|uniref:PKD domain-containing protein n=1 Tax=Salinimicrobium sediminis TaxID=1343891 RepID=A0A285X5Z0_9FLAO|nr:PKD domain-containing protein [Salinimicrobium sediminis]SOC79829.1 hypothetical protein SAMN06296241_1366 [Salinimicrobium sediminis]